MDGIGALLFFPTSKNSISRWRFPLPSAITLPLHLCLSMRQPVKHSSDYLCYNTKVSLSLQKQTN